MQVMLPWEGYIPLWLYITSHPILAIGQHYINSHSLRLFQGCSRMCQVGKAKYHNAIAPFRPSCNMWMMMQFYLALRQD